MANTRRYIIDEQGERIGVLLDLWIREQTNNTRSLDDMMRAMNEQFGKTGKPYRDREDLEAVCAQTAKASDRVRG